MIIILFWILIDLNLSTIPYDYVSLFQTWNMRISLSNQVSKKNVVWRSSDKSEIAGMIRYISMNRILPDTPIPYHQTIDAIDAIIKPEKVVWYRFSIGADHFSWFTLLIGFLFMNRIFVIKVKAKNISFFFRMSNEYSLPYSAIEKLLKFLQISFGYLWY